MSLAPSVAVPRAGFNPLPLYIGLFCLLWSFAFVAGKIGVTDCPPLILLTARFSLAGILILGVTALRGGVNGARHVVQRFGYYTISLTFAWALLAFWRVKDLARAEAAGIARRERWQAAALILAVGEPVVRILYGANWTAAAPLMPWAPPLRFSPTNWFP